MLDSASLKRWSLLKSFLTREFLLLLFPGKHWSSAHYRSPAWTVNVYGWIPLWNLLQGVFSTSELFQCCWRGDKEEVGERVWASKWSPPITVGQQDQKTLPISCSGSLKTRWMYRTDHRSNSGTDRVIPLYFRSARKTTSGNVPHRS